MRTDQGLYYRVLDTLDPPRGRWYLGSLHDGHGQEVEPWEFLCGRPSAFAGPLWIELDGPGNPLDFTFAGFDVPIIRRGLGDFIQQLAPGAVQRLPARIEGYPDEFEILNVLHRIDCLNESRTEHITRWTVADGRPEKVGQYRMISGLRIRPDAASAPHIFRVEGWEVALICSARFRDAVEKYGASGFSFQDVS